MRHRCPDPLARALLVFSMSKAALAAEPVPVTTAAAAPADAAALAVKLQNPVVDLRESHFIAAATYPSP